MYVMDKCHQSGVAQPHGFGGWATVERTAGEADHLASPSNGTGRGPLTTKKSSSLLE